MVALGRVWKLYFFYTILLVIGAALAGFLLEAEVKTSLTEHLEEDSLTLAKVIAQSLPDTEDSSVLDQFCDSFRNAAGARITLMDREGKVRGESDADTVEVGTKLDRPEVKEAVSKGAGSSIRFSKTARSNCASRPAVPHMPLPNQKGSFSKTFQGSTNRRGDSPAPASQ